MELVVPVTVPVLRRVYWPSDNRLDFYQNGNGRMNERRRRDHAHPSRRRNGSNSPGNIEALDCIVDKATTISTGNGMTARISCRRKRTGTYRALAVRRISVEVVVRL